MRTCRPGGRNDATDLVQRSFQQHGGGDVFADQNAVFGELANFFRFLILQLGEQAQAKVADIRHALAQIGIFHGREALHVLVDDFAQRTLCPVASLDAFGDFTAEGVVVEHAQIDIKERTLFRHQCAGHALIQRLHFFADGLQRLGQQGQLAVDIVNCAIRHLLQIGFRIEHHGASEGDAGSAGNALIDLGRCGARAAYDLQLAHDLGMGNHAGQLC